MKGEGRKSREDLAAEAVGERDRSATPQAAKDRVENPPEEAARQAARPSGPRASTAAIAAEAVGERVEEGYADVPTEKAARLSARAVRHAAPPAVGRLAAGQPLLMMLAGFTVGYAAALLIHGRR